jgi:dihydroxyacetone kinase-like predicted kinase
MFNNTSMPGITENDLALEWHAAYEVCFYRDFIKKFGFKGDKSLRTANQKYKTQFSEKRTFDLCLFSDKKIVVFEAKVQQPFDEKQVLIFDKDKDLINLLVGDDVEVVFVAIASSLFFDRYSTFGKKVKPAMDRVFGKNILSWKNLADEACPVYHPHFLTVDALYKH